MKDKKKRGNDTETDPTCAPRESNWNAHRSAECLGALLSALHGLLGGSARFMPCRTGANKAAMGSRLGLVKQRRSPPPLSSA